jgi:hypothetical protein
MDDYSYKGQGLTKKADWPYALSSESKFGVNGLTGRSPVPAISGGNPGPRTVINNYTTIGVEIPSGSGILGGDSDALEWIQTTNCEEPE